MKLERFEKHYYDKKYNEFEDDFNDIKELILPDTPYSSFALKCIYRKISGKPYEYLVEKIIESVLWISIIIWFNFEEIYKLKSALALYI